LPDLLTEGRIALGTKLQNRKIGLTCSFDFDSPRFTKTLRRRPITASNARWLAYATASAATALTGTPSAEAEIHYSGIVNYPFSGTQGVSSAYFPLNQSASLFFQHFNIGAEGGARIEIVGPDGRAGDSIGGLVGTFVLYGGFYVSNLAPRVNLSRLTFGAYCRFTSTGSELHCFGGTIGYTQRPNGKFRRPGEGFVGFTFDTGAGPQYGWARIKTSGEPKYRFILHDYAWADPGESIQTGQKRSGADPGESIQTSQKGSSRQMTTVPDRGSLGLLALGAAGLIASRNRRAPVPGSGGQRLTD
jgi:hypothetical protein